MTAAQIVLSSKGRKKSSALCQAVFFQLPSVPLLLLLQPACAQTHYSWRWEAVVHGRLLWL